MNTDQQSMEIKICVGHFSTDSIDNLSIDNYFKDHSEIRDIAKSIYQASDSFKECL